jgi:hypothetical protein
MVSVESLNVILITERWWPVGLSIITVVLKTGILSITFAKREQYSQKLRDIYVTIPDAQKLSTVQCRGNSPELTDSTAASVVYQWLHHLFAQYEYTVWCKLALCSKYGKISHVTWKIPLLVKHCYLTVVAYLGYYVALKLRFFTPGPNHRISSRDGCYVAMGCLPLNITNIYFILREWVHQYNGHGRGAIELVYHGSPLLGHRQACMDQRQ